MKRLARMSLRVRLTLLFAVLTAAAWGVASVIAWQQTSKKLDKLFDTQQLLFARRLSAMHFDELRAPPASLGEKKKVRHGHIDDDALVEVTPKVIRLRKRELDPNERKRASRKE